MAQAERLEETGALDRYCQLPAAGAATETRDSFRTGSEMEECDLELESPQLNRDR